MTCLIGYIQHRCVTVIRIASCLCMTKNNKDHKDPTNENTTRPKSIRFGKGLGEWEDEMKAGDWIEELIVGGAKSYAYRTHKGKIVVKQKGITLDRANETKVNFETFKQMVLNQKVFKTTPLPWDPILKIETIPRFTFAWTAVSKYIITNHIGRSVRSTIGEKRLVDGFDTIPYGY